MRFKDLQVVLPELETSTKANPDIKGLTEDSRKVKKGFIFVAVKGLTTDGHLFIGDAVKNGASIVIGEKKREKIIGLEHIPYIKVANPRTLLGLLASEYHKNPSHKLKVIGVTGTDGKTTTCNLINHIFNNCGKKTGLVSTISARIGKKEIDTGFHVTSPDPVSLQKLLAEMVKKKCEYAVVEVTSHALAQGRVEGVRFDSAVLTNITHEHLDYHKTWESYRDAKSTLFKNAQTFVVLNADDLSSKYISDLVTEGVGKYCYSLNPSNMVVYAQNITYQHECMSFEVVDGINALTFNTSLIGDYNISNILAAITCVRQYGLELKDIKKAVQSFTSPVGRLQKIKNPKGFDIYVDFAHTPNSLESVLTALNKLKTKDRRLIAIFGCAGERDTEKRQIMGEIAGRLADISVFTAEDPRSEDVNKIINRMAVGANKDGGQEMDRYIDLNQLSNNHIFIKIPERGEAISLAIQKLARKGDIVVICGKGHERSMAYNGIEYPWSDQDAVRVALKGKVKRIIRTDI